MFRDRSGFISDAQKVRGPHGVDVTETKEIEPRTAGHPSRLDRSPNFIEDFRLYYSEVMSKASAPDDGRDAIASHVQCSNGSQQFGRGRQRLLDWIFRGQVQAIRVSIVPHHAGE